MQNILNPKRSIAKVISLADKVVSGFQFDYLRGKLIIPYNDGHRFIDFEDIIRLESASNYTKVHTRLGKTYLVSRTMKSIIEKLPVNTFLRVHNSHVINVNMIVLLTKECIQLSDKSAVPISRSNKKMVFERLGVKK